MSLGSHTDPISFVEGLKRCPTGARPTQPTAGSYKRQGNAAFALSSLVVFTVQTNILHQYESAEWARPTGG